MSFEKTVKLEAFFKMEISTMKQNFLKIRQQWVFKTLMLKTLDCLSQS